MVTARRGTAGLAVVIVAVASLWAAAPAWSHGNSGTPAPPPATPTAPAVTQNQGDTGSTEHGTVAACSIYGGPDGFGLSCAGGGNVFQTIRQVLGKDPLPTCWDVAFTPQELAQLNPPDTKQFRFYWRTCLGGIDPVKLTLLPGGATFTQELKWLPVDAKGCPSPKPAGLAAHREDACVMTLTANQQRLVKMQDDGRIIPFPAIAPTPSQRVRVNAAVDFVLETPTEVGPARVGGVEMRAVMTGLTIAADHATALTPTTASKSCGVGAKAGDTPDSLPTGCWFRFDRSSAAQPDGKYPVHVTASWQIQVNAGGGWTQFTRFTKYQDTLLPVTEIQSIVVS